MKGVKAIAAMLAANATVTGFVGTRIHAMQRIESSDFPGIAIQVNGIEPNGTKSGASNLDIYDITVGIYDDARDADFFSLCEAVRTALDRIIGTYASVEVKGCDFQDARYEDIIVARPIWICEQDYRLMVTA